MSSQTPPHIKPPKLLDRVRSTMRLNRYSPRTEQAYVDWIKRFIRFHGIRHPQEMGADEVEAFLSHLAVEMNVPSDVRLPLWCRPPSRACARGMGRSGDSAESRQRCFL